MKTTAVIVAAGRGSRMGADQNKVFLSLLGKTVILHTLDVFSECDKVDDIIIVTRECDIDKMSELCRGAEKITAIIPGGEQRQHSVMAGLLAAANSDYVIIHDGARALITEDIIESTLADAVSCDAAATGVLCKDTLKSADADGFITATLDRASTYLIHTPQIFRYDKIIKAHNLAAEDNFLATDDCALYEKYIGKVKITLGSYENIKLTTPEDMQIAEKILERRAKK